MKRVGEHNSNDIPAKRQRKTVWNDFVSYVQDILSIDKHSSESARNFTDFNLNQGFHYHPPSTENGFSKTNNQDFSLDVEKNRMDADLQEAIAYSLSTDEAGEKNENKSTQRIPFGYEEKAQEMIGKLHLLWQNSFLKCEYKLSDLDKEKLALKNEQIDRYFIELNECINEKTFQCILFKISWLAIKSANIYHGYFMNHKKECEKFEKFLIEENLLEPFKNHMLAEYNETLSKYTLAFKFLTYLKAHNEKTFEYDFWDSHRYPFKEIEEGIKFLELNFNKEKISLIKENLFEHFSMVENLKEKYPNLIERFEPHLKMIRKSFDIIVACNKMGLLPELTTTVVQQACDPQIKLLEFSYSNVQKIKTDLQKLEQARNHRFQVNLACLQEVNNERKNEANT